MINCIKLPSFQGWYLAYESLTWWFGCGTATTISVPDVPAWSSGPRIKSLSGAGSPGFTSVRAAAQTRRAYPGELRQMAVNWHPNCNPADVTVSP